MKIIIVDEKDQEIGLKDRKNRDQKDIYRVAALWITNNQGEILLAQRAFNKKHHPGKWGPAVAGTIEAGETYESNIIKEAEEELGLKGIKFQPGPKTRTVGEYNHFTQWFKLKLDQPIEAFTVNPDEVAEIKWFTRQEIEENLKNNPADFLSKMKDYIKYL